MLLKLRRAPDADPGLTIDDVVLGSCDRHGFERAAGVCRSCHYPHCETCLVYPFGPAKPPYCVSCALVAAGVRRG